MVLWLFAAGLFSCLCRVCLIVYGGFCLALRSSDLGKRASYTFCLVVFVCHVLFALPHGVIGRLCSVIVALPGHLLFYFP